MYNTLLTIVGRPRSYYKLVRKWYLVIIVLLVTTVLTCLGPIKGYFNDYGITPEVSSYMKGELASYEILGSIDDGMFTYTGQDLKIDMKNLGVTVILGNLDTYSGELTKSSNSMSISTVLHFKEKQADELRIVFGKMSVVKTYEYAKYLPNCDFQNLKSGSDDWFALVKAIKEVQKDQSIIAHGVVIASTLVNLGFQILTILIVLVVVSRLLSIRNNVPIFVLFILAGFGSFWIGIGQLLSYTTGYGIFGTLGIGVFALYYFIARFGLRVIPRKL